MGTRSRFVSFLRNINTTTVDIDDANTKIRNVASTLHRNYYNTAYDGSTRLVIGSYGKKTQVRPRRDVDILFLMPYSAYVQYNSYKGNGQSALLQDVKAVLRARFTTTEKIRGDGQVVVVEFSGGHTVELLPAWITTDRKYIVPNTHDGGSWKTVDHAAEMANVESSDARSNGNTRNLIKMMKVWQAYCNVPIKSLVLELRAVNFMSQWAHYNKDAYYYDYMVRDFFKGLIENSNNYCVIPGIEERCYYGNAWVSRAESAHDRAMKACRYEADNNDYEATLEWRKIFGAQYEF